MALTDRTYALAAVWSLLLKGNTVAPYDVATSTQVVKDSTSTITTTCDDGLVPGFRRVPIQDARYNRSEKVVFDAVPLLPF